VDASTVQLITASVGVAGTLTAAVLTQMLARRAESDRRASEDRARWLQERLRVNSQFLSGALALERDIWSADSQLDRDSRNERMPGYTTILLTPKEGLPGIFDELTRTILVEAIEDAYSRLDEMELLVAQIALIGTLEEAIAARTLHEALWDAAGMLETYASFDDACEVVLAARRARDHFAEAARSGLRVDGEAVPVDRRPRLDVRPTAEGDASPA
jgi:hypothetical protein